MMAYPATPPEAHHSLTISETHIYLEAYDYDYVEEQPQFPGGDQAMLRFINNERRYPSSSYKTGIEGRVMCGFIVNADGSLSHVAVVRGVTDDLDDEAVRVISKMPRWKPGKVGGETVPVYCLLTIPFRK